MSVKPDTAAALAFLRNYEPSGPWVLTAIRPDRKAISTATFRPGQEEAAQKWIDEYNGNRNIYFHVNPTLRDMTRKADREDVKALAFLHVDLDPRPGEDIAKERERALGLLRQPPGNIPPPTIIIDSGGGYQGFWRLREAQPINGDLAKAEDAKLWNLELELRFGADNCHNVDRIMRLPGTINLPDEKKRKKGRKPALATLIEFHGERVYDISEFKKAPPDGGSASAPARRSAAPADIRFLFADDLDLSALTEKQQDLTRAVITHGPTEEHDFGGNRSDAVFYVACSLLRAGRDDAEILGVLLNPENRIHDHIRDKGGNNLRSYAQRQIDRAREDVAKEPATINPNAPLRVADSFLAQRARLLHHNGDYLSHDGAAYYTLEEGTVRAEMYGFVEHARISTEKGPKPYNPHPKHISAFLDALRARAHLPANDHMRPPLWLDGRAEPAPGEVIACRNGLLHLATGELMPLTPDFFTRNALDFDYDPAAPEPARWLTFLNEVWPSEDEKDCITCLQELFGYVLTPDTSQQKAFLLVTPRRGGKGTIARVLTRLVGQRNVAAPSLKQVGDPFGLEGLISKQLAIISDMRLDNKADHAAIAENLLRISGEDMVSVSRKYKQDWEGYLSVRFLILSNELPQLRDVSGALASRFIALEGHQSWFGREDPGLTGKLLVELPGILNWAIAGWRRLRERGHFVPPACSSEVTDLIEKMGSPVKGFLEERCTLEPGAEADKDELFAAFRHWHVTSGKPYTGRKEHFARDLIAASGGRVRAAKLRAGENRRRVFVGVRLLQPSTNEEIPF